MFKISRKKLVQKLAQGEFDCSTAFRNADNTFAPFMERGKRTFVKATSYGAVLLSGDGSPNVGKEVDLRFEKGDICFESIDGNLIVVGSDVTVKYVKQVAEETPKRTTIETGDVVKYSESALRSLRDSVHSTGCSVEKSKRQGWLNDKMAERGTIVAIEKNAHCEYYRIRWERGSETTTAKHLVRLAD